MKILLAPHNDDEALFCSYTIMRFKPLVIICTDSKRQESRGITAEQRRQESINACKVLGCNCEFLGIPDEDLNMTNLREHLYHLKPDIIFAPALQGGHRDHNVVSSTADFIWQDKVIHYATYTETDLVPNGNFEITPTLEELKLKELALNCYPSQEHCKGHFDAVRGKSEYWIV